MVRPIDSIWTFVKLSGQTHQMKRRKMIQVASCLLASSLSSNIRLGKLKLSNDLDQIEEILLSNFKAIKPVQPATNRFIRDFLRPMSRLSRSEIPGGYMIEYENQFSQMVVFSSSHEGKKLVFRQA